MDESVKIPKANRTIIVAPGPTISSLNDVKEFDLAIFIGDSFKRTSLRSPKQNIYVRANTEYPNLLNEVHAKDLREFDGSIYIASSVMESQTPVFLLVKEFLEGKNVFLFDQRHFGGKDCAPKKDCCNSKMGITLQEILQTKAGLPHHYSPGMTVLAHAISIALIAGSKKITIIGADLPLNAKKYVYGGLNHAKFSAKKYYVKIWKLISGKYSMDALLENVRFKVAKVLLGDRAPSIFAQDYVELYTDFQYLADVAAILGTSISVVGEESTLRKIHGFISAH